MTDDQIAQLKAIALEACRHNLDAYDQFKHQCYPANIAWLCSQKRAPRCHHNWTTKSGAVIYVEIPGDMPDDERLQMKRMLEFVIQNELDERALAQEEGNDVSLSVD